MKLLSITRKQIQNIILILLITFVVCVLTNLTTECEGAQQCYTGVSDGYNMTSLTVVTYNYTDNYCSKIAAKCRSGYNGCSQQDVIDGTVKYIYGATDSSTCKKLRNLYCCADDLCNDSNIICMSAILFVISLLVLVFV